MHAPESFVEKLEDVFGGRLRIRWSNQRHGWLIEQKVKRGLFPGTKPTAKGWDESSDKYVQNRDGYVELMEVRSGTLMDCPKCGTELKVPFMDTTAVRCPMCRMNGHDPAINVVFIPLNDSLIDKLRSLDPTNPISDALADDIDRANEALEAAMLRGAVNIVGAGARERYNRLWNVVQKGYTGREKMWRK